MTLVQISIVCSGCEQQVSGFVQVRKSNRVAHLLEEALAAAHLAACYIEEDPRGREEQGSTDPTAAEDRSEEPGEEVPGVSRSIDAVH